MDLYLSRLQGAIASATQGITETELNRHPPGKWSVAEVLEHLYLTYTVSVKGFERCLAAGRPLATYPTLKHRLFTAAVTRAGHFPSGRKSPELVKPKGAAANIVLNDIARQISLMDDVMSKCEARYGPRTRLLDHPVLGPLTAPQWRKFHWLHGRHHIQQIARLRN